MCRFRLFLLLFVCAAILFGRPASTQAQVEHTINDITGADRIASTSLQNTTVVRYSGTDIAYKAEYTRPPDTSAGTWVLNFYGFTAEPTDLSEPHRVLIWVDGQRHDVVNTEARLRDLEGEILEIQLATLQAPLFQGIAEADEVEVTIGDVEFDIPYADRADMREIVERVQSVVSSESLQRRAGAEKSY
jgi:hypothetical protein